MSKRGETAPKIATASVPMILAAVAGVLINARCAASKPPNPVTATLASSSNASPSATANITISTPPLSPPPPEASRRAKEASNPDPPVTKNYYVSSDRQSGGITAGEVHLHPVDRQPDNSEVEKLREELATIKEYSEVAKLDVDGTDGTAVPPLFWETPISKSMKAAISLEGDHHKFLCDENAMSAYHATALRFPKFPFSYFGLATCLRTKGNILWNHYAQKAVEILNKTTTIEGHHPIHGWALGQLKLIGTTSAVGAGW